MSKQEIFKTCSSCKKVLNLNNFYNNSRTKDGKSFQCIGCGRLYRQKNKEKIAKARHESYLKNKDTLEFKEKRARYSKENKEKIKQRRLRYTVLNKKHKSAYDKNYRLKNIKKIKKYNFNYRLKNIGKKKEYDKKYYIKNKEKIKKNKNEYLSKNKKEINKKSIEKIKRNPILKLKKLLRCRVNKIIKGQIKSGSAVRDLGCSIEELKAYLESKFQEGMSWDNYGIYGWHIDHIIPLSSFDLTDPEQFKKACHYTNLQPLWAEDNLKKGCRL